MSFCNQYKNTPLNKTIQITVAQGIDPIESQDESLILTYKEKPKTTLSMKNAQVLLLLMKMKLF